MPWYLILILVLGFSYGLFLLTLGGREGAKAIKEKKALDKLEAPLHSLFHVSSAPVRKNPLAIKTEVQERKEEKS